MGSACSTLPVCELVVKAYKPSTLHGCITRHQSFHEDHDDDDHFERKYALPRGWWEAGAPDKEVRDL